MEMRALLRQVGQHTAVTTALQFSALWKQQHNDTKLRLRGEKGKSSKRPEGAVRVRERDSDTHGKASQAAGGIHSPEGELFHLICLFVLGSPVLRNIKHCTLQQLETRVRQLNTGTFPPKPQDKQSNMSLQRGGSVAWCCSVLYITTIVFTV